ncbi:MAG: hypothetical protein SF162_14495 [bacterium]|nr:hypothetical protein [bacterium]
MTGQYQRTYGKTINPFVCRKPDSDTILLGGQGDDLNRWTRLLTNRASRLLWFHLGSVLHPDLFREKTPGLGTLPIRSARLPTITSDLILDQTAQGEYEIIGRGGGSQWSARFNPDTARQLWNALDDLLSE